MVESHSISLLLIFDLSQGINKPLGKIPWKRATANKGKVLEAGEVKREYLWILGSTNEGGNNKAG